MIGKRFFASRLWALMCKETIQSFRNPQIVVFLLVSPIFQLVTYGVALNPEIHDIKLGVVDDARSNASKELIAAFVENKVFALDANTRTYEELDHRLRDGRIDAGLVIPVDFERNRARDREQTVQVLVDGVNAYTAGLAVEYASEIVAEYGRRGAAPPVKTAITFLYNPGLIASWFFVPGIIGLLMTTLGIITVAFEAVREKERGTLEQLMMTPASSLEVLVAKTVPTFFLTMAAFYFSFVVAHVVFAVPLRGDPFALSLATAVYVVVAMSIGLMFATFAETTMQAIMLSLFVTLPMVQLSGTIAPVESMPPFFLNLSLVNPLRHYATVLRDVLVKGDGFETVWPQLIYLAVSAIVLLGASSMRFRSQLK